MIIDTNEKYNNTIKWALNDMDDLSHKVYDEWRLSANLHQITQQSTNNLIKWLRMQLESQAHVYSYRVISDYYHYQLSKPNLSTKMKGTLKDKTLYYLTNTSKKEQNNYYERHGQFNPKTKTWKEYTMADLKRYVHQLTNQIPRNYYDIVFTAVGVAEMDNVKCTYHNLKIHINIIAAIVQVDAQNVIDWFNQQLNGYMFDSNIDEETPLTGNINYPESMVIYCDNQPEIIDWEGLKILMLTFNDQEGETIG